MKPTIVRDHRDPQSRDAVPKLTPLEAHTFDPSILRAYDIRGIMGQTLSVHDALAIGRAFGSEVIDAGGHRVCVGWDGRLSSPELVSALIDGLTQVSIHVVKIGCGPTPMLYFAEHALNADAAVMVTGSHNPADHNGFKLSFGRKPFFGEDIQRLGVRAQQGHFHWGRGRQAEIDLMDRYVARLLADAAEVKPLRVAWDAGNGAAGEAMLRLSAGLPGVHFMLNEVVDGTFPNHHPDPTEPENLVQLQKCVASEKCDLGIAFDGDGDRIGVIDRRGRIIWGDQLLMILCADILSESPGSMIIADVKASQCLFDRVNELGGDPLMWKTGHSLIKTKMAQTGALLAGEMSGHLFFADRYYGFDDALYAAMRLLEVLGKSGCDLADIIDTLPVVANTPEIRIPCEENRKFEVVEAVRARLSAEGASVNDIDGVRVLTDHGWWLLRASNTQAVLVARCEAATPEQLSRLRLVVAGHLEACGVSSQPLL